MNAEHRLATALLACALTPPSVNSAGAPPSPTVRDRIDCPEMASVPAGTYFRGSSGGDADELPVQAVNVPALLVGRYEVAHSEYGQFVDDTRQRGRKCPSTSLPLRNSSTLLLWIVVVMAYGSVWFGLAISIIALGKRSATNALALMGALLFFVVLLPVRLNISAKVAYPVPSRIELSGICRLRFWRKWP